MKIKIIIPNSSTEFRDSQIEERKKAAGPGVKVEVVCLKEGPVSLEASFDEELAAPSLLREVKKAEKEGFDAISIDCAADPSLRAVREIANIPVASGGEASLLYALSLGDKFSVVTVLEHTARIIEENIRSYGLQFRMASVRFANVPVLELENLDVAKEAILKEAKKAIKEDGADVIVLGCTGMSPVTRHLRKELEAPVVDPAVSALRMAEALVRMGLTHSKLCYLNPPKKEIKGEYYKDF